MKQTRKITDGSDIDSLQVESAVLRHAIMESSASRGFGAAAYMPLSAWRAARRRAQCIDAMRLALGDASMEG